MKYLQQFFSSITCGIKSGIQKSENEYQKQVNENRRNAITAIHLNMVEELFLAFRNGHYGVVKPIGSVQNIRPDGWFARGGQIFFRYRLMKESSGRVSGVVRDSIRDNMNSDLRYTRQNLFNRMGANAYYLHPNLASGIMVVDVLDTEIEIVVLCIVNMHF